MTILDRNGGTVRLQGHLVADVVRVVRDERDRDALDHENSRVSGADGDLDARAGLQPNILLVVANQEL
jgi:hypothetical protein